MHQKTGRRACRQTAEKTFHGFIGADVRGELSLAETPPAEKRERIAQNGGEDTVQKYGGPKNIAV